MTKSYTDIEQSKQLAEILPIESADMRYGYIAPYDYPDRMYDGGYDEIPYPKDFLKKNPNFSENEYDGELPAWSLAALLDIFPKGEYKDIDLCYGGYEGDKYVSEWFCSYEEQNPFIIEVCHADNPIDACYEMIVKLKEKGLI